MDSYRNRPACVRRSVVSAGHIEVSGSSPLCSEDLWKALKVGDRVSLHFHPDPASIQRIVPAQNPDIYGPAIVLEDGTAAGMTWGAENNGNLQLGGVFLIRETVPQNGPWTPTH